MILTMGENWCSKQACSLLQELTGIQQAKSENLDGHYDNNTKDYQTHHYIGRVAFPLAP